MPEWVPIAAAGTVLLIFLIIILVRIVSLGRDQREIVRTLNLLMDMVEFQSDSINRKIESSPVNESPEEPSMIAYRKPTLREETKAKPPPPPPPPPPAKLKRW
jgi:hypothetical protein